MATSLILPLHWIADTIDAHNNDGSSGGCRRRQGGWKQGTADKKIVHFKNLKLPSPSTEHFLDQTTVHTAKLNYYSGHRGARDCLWLSSLCDVVLDRGWSTAMTMSAQSCTTLLTLPSGSLSGAYRIDHSMERINRKGVRGISVIKLNQSMSNWRWEKRSQAMGTDTERHWKKRRDSDVPLKWESGCLGCCCCLMVVMMVNTACRSLFCRIIHKLVHTMCQWWWWWLSRSFSQGASRHSRSHWDATRFADTQRSLLSGQSLSPAVGSASTVAAAAAVCLSPMFAAVSVFWWW